MTEHTLREGDSLTVSKVVGANDTAMSYDSGLVDVLATPAMVALMESAAYRLAQPHLPEGYSTVGIEVATSHVKASPIGMKVKATATLTKVDGRKLLFSITASDEEGAIGTATHTRSIVDVAKFMAKLKQ